VNPTIPTDIVLSMMLVSFCPVAGHAFVVIEAFYSLRFNRSGAALDGSAYQDALEHIHVSLILDILSRKVLVSTTTHHS